MQLIKLITSLLLVSSLLVVDANAGITFNGSTDFLSTTTMGTFGSDIGSTYYVFSGWVKSSNTTSGMSVGGTFNTGTSTAVRLQLNISPADGTTVSAGRIYVFKRSVTGPNLMNGGVNSDTGITDGNWHHLLISLNPTGATGIKIWVDGASQTITYLTNQNTFGTNDFGFAMYVGSSNNRGAVEKTLDGVETEVAMWASSVDPSAGDVTTLSTRTRGGPLLVTALDGLKGYWKMNDGTSGSSNGASVADYGGNSYTGTVTGGTWYDDCIDLFTCSSGVHVFNNATMRNMVVK